MATTKKRDAQHEALKAALEARRGELGLDQSEVAAKSGITTQTYRDLWNPNRTHRPQTVAAVEAALELEPGSIESATAGGELVPRRPRRAGEPRGTVAQQADDMTTYAMILLETRDDLEAWSETWKQYRDKFDSDQIRAIRERLITLVAESRRAKGA